LADQTPTLETTELSYKLFITTYSGYVKEQEVIARAETLKILAKTHKKT
jgi:hypothetical protein